MPIAANGNTMTYFVISARPVHRPATAHHPQERPRSAIQNASTLAAWNGSSALLWL